ncbi:hypothetical protein GW17_00056144 [Ensete ventricosum]|nr:hypothetical protein GW17_00056144 [Ensete ventricosum]
MRRRGWPWLAARGSRLRPTPPAGAAGCRQDPPARGLPATCKGRPPVGVTAHKGRPPAGATGCGQPARAAASDAPARDGRQRPAHKRLPTAHPQGATTSGQPTQGYRQ